jgi:hypothetical protein
MSAGTAGAGVSVETGRWVKVTQSMADRAAPAVVQPRLVRPSIGGGIGHSNNQMMCGTPGSLSSIPSPASRESKARCRSNACSLTNAGSSLCCAPSESCHCAERKALKKSFGSNQAVRQDSASLGSVVRRASNAALSITEAIANRLMA